MQSIRRLGLVGALVALVAGMVLAPAAHAAPVPLQEANFTAYATGTVVHADALESAEQDIRLLDVEEAFSGAAVEPAGIDPRITNEFDRVVAPAGNYAYYARGSGLEVGLAHPPDGENQVIVAGLAESKDGKESTEEVGPVPAEPLAYATALKGNAFTANGATDCNLGGDLARGMGLAADAQLLDTDGEANGDERLDEPLVAADAPGPDRAVAQSTSRVRLVPQVSKDGEREGNAFGVMSETRMTIAPITLGGQVTIEFLGEWVLRAVATGESGYVHYGPAQASPSTPILRVIDQTTKEVTDVLTFQQFFDNEGLVVEVEPLGLEIAIGEDPRAIGGNAASSPTQTATLASAAVDVVRIRALDVPDMGTLADLRIGHMEARAQVPAGGVTCDLTVSKTANPASVTAGDDFTYTITVANTFDCRLTDVSVRDIVTATDGVAFTVKGASHGGVVDGNRVTWDDIGPINPGDKKSVTISMGTDAGSAAGRIIDDVRARASCALASAQGGAAVKVPVTGRAHLEQPEVKAAGAETAGEPEVRPAGEAQPAPQGELPRTGGPLSVLAGSALLGGGALLRHLRRRLPN